MAALLKVPDVAARLGLSPLQVRSEHTRGMLPARLVSGRFLRFTEDDIAAYLARIADDKGGKKSGQTERSAARSK